MKKIFLLLALLCFTITALADFGAAKVAEQKGDYQTAIKEYLPLAKAGDAMAQLNLGYIYIYLKNYSQAYYWTKKAADAGMGKAKTNLGLLYLTGWGIKKDYQKAYHLLKPQALKGDNGAQINLGHMYDYALGVKQNYQIAAYWYKKAIYGGNATAAHNLAMLYVNGYLASPDYNKITNYLIIGAKGGRPDDMYNLGLIYESGIIGSVDYPEAYKWYSLAVKQDCKPADTKIINLKKKMTSIQVTEGNRKIKEFLAKYRQNLIDAKHKIGIYYNSCV